MPTKHSLENVLVFLVSISFWLFMATIPPLRIGIWVDSEFVLVAANVLFALIGLVLGGLLLYKIWLFLKKYIPV
jgi:hypothetical protein